MAPKIQYLGHVIDKNGLHPSSDKVRAIRESQTTRNITKLRAFFGMLNYYSKFFPNVTSTLAPLYALLHKKSTS